MRWRGRRTSTNISDRRGRGGGRRVAGGGIGVLAIVLIGMFFGVDLTPLLGGGGMGQVSAPAPSGPNTIDDSREEFVGVVLAETEQVWGTLFANSDLTYTEPQLVLFEGTTNSGCGFAQSATGPFYCPADNSIFLDMSFFDVMEQRLGAEGDFAKAYVIAHEVGHHVQNLLGTLGEVNARRSAMAPAESNALSVRTELQADCFSGLWAREAAERLALTPQDITNALDAAAAIGDDALQRASGGQVVPDSFTHGSSAQRQRWFTIGYETGNPSECDTFSAGSL